MDYSLELKNLSFKRDDHIIFENINLCVANAAKIGLVGANGSGKTTLLEVSAGLLEKSGGEIHLFGKKMNEMKDFDAIRGKIGFLFQDSNDQFLFPLVEDDIAFSLLNSGIHKEEAYKKVDEMLAKLGISRLKGKIVYHLSGGEKKLVALAGVLINPPKFIFLDEPTNELDAQTRLNLITILNALEISMFIASHDSEFISEICEGSYTLLRK